MKKKKIVILTIVFGLVIFCFILPVVLFLSLFLGSRTLELGLDNFPGVPPEARNIDHFKLNDIATGLETLDFTISEPDFKNTAKLKKWTLKEIETPLAVKTTSFFAGKQKKEIIVQKGLHLSDVGSNGGGVTVIYDRENQRAHIFKSNR